jgi:hypothetical protein
MLHWTQQLWIDPCQSRKRSSVDPIILAPALPDQSHARRRVEHAVFSKNRDRLLTSDVAQQFFAAVNQQAKRFMSMRSKKASHGDSP